MSAIEEVAAAVRAIADRLPDQEIAIAVDALQDCHTVFAAVMEGSWAEEPALVSTWLASALHQLAEVTQLLAELRTRLNNLADNLAAPPAPANLAPAPPAPAPAPAPAAQRPFPVDREWGQRARARLPTRPNDKGPTLGIYVDEDGIEHPVRSGREEDGVDLALAKLMVEQGMVPAIMKNPGGATHVELKVAYRMRASNTQYAELAINNKIDREQYGCHELLPKVLLPGQTMVIHDTTGTHIYRGTPQP
ncbi:SCP1.201-like deaminase [Streptoalloteichus tenebrarius]|uniref:SCP1.201-like deaminase n=1 Tax=Streptoalloteichus tenebrarius (strain ATCC 17920 / DSM 40477 / JCM 4838 / CBS 697.72 / NBRC 16177 / NCIMB 11028 / NRRL B-12390 / A12253. 1 / ISP 5477) TaxID=1933 RepID=A0ABT1HP64_STRSD|nr:DddA-like double-stranded DNA deaminase toxin [Streptoalloteichus tenebrarius]MCP2257270.1 SCP1.201-like deaminase [Streptoalloteichus tenebrarius]BFF04177.1 hypothetical protein GCM10020241_58520 [Streptoalloteichus tenebrarius]